MRCKEVDNFGGDDSEGREECKEIMGRRGSILAVMKVIGDKNTRSSWEEESGSRW